jgi:hypothetical protein
MTSAPHDGQFMVWRFSLENVSTGGLSQFIWSAAEVLLSTSAT